MSDVLFTVEVTRRMVWNLAFWVGLAILFHYLISWHNSGKLDGQWKAPLFILGIDAYAFGMLLAIFR